MREKAALGPREPLDRNQINQAAANPPGLNLQRSCNISDLDLNANHLLFPKRRSATPPPAGPPRGCSGFWTHIRTKVDISNSDTL